MERYTPEQIHDEIATQVKDDNLRRAVALALSKAPREVVDHFLGGCLFLMPAAQEKGCYLPRETVAGKAIVALSESLLADPEELELTILRQVAHLWLGHKDPHISGVSSEEYDRQQAEANELVASWLKRGGSR